MIPIAPFCLVMALHRGTAIKRRSPRSIRVETASTVIYARLDGSTRINRLGILHQERLSPLPPRRHRTCCRSSVRRQNGQTRFPENSRNESLWEPLGDASAGRFPRFATTQFGVALIGPAPLTAVPSSSSFTDSRFSLRFSDRLAYTKRVHDRDNDLENIRLATTILLFLDRK